MTKSENDALSTFAGYCLIGLIGGFVYTMATDDFWGYVIAVACFWLLVIAGAVMTLNDVTGAVQKPREVHHYHRITIDQNGNPVEVTDYVRREV